MLQLLQVLLLQDHPRTAILGPNRTMLFRCVAIVQYEELVHLRQQIKELRDRFAVRILIEFANHVVVASSKTRPWLALSNDRNSKCSRAAKMEAVTTQDMSVSETVRSLYAAGYLFKM